MSSPYSSSLLKESPVEAARAAERAGSAALRPAQPLQPAYAQQTYAPMIVGAPQQYMTYAPAATRSGGSKLASVGWVLLVLLVAAATAIGGWAIARFNSPTQMEVNGYQTVAARQGQFQGQLSGISDGKAFAENMLSDQTQIEGEIAQAKSYNHGYNNGKSLGESSEKSLLNSWSRPYYGGGYGYGYGGYGYGGGYYGGGVSGALSEAQGIANATGQPVSVDIP